MVKRAVVQVTPLNAPRPSPFGSSTEIGDIGDVGAAWFRLHDHPDGVKSQAIMGVSTDNNLQPTLARRYHRYRMPLE